MEKVRGDIGEPSLSSGPTGLKEEEEGWGLGERRWFKAPLRHAGASLQFPTRALSPLCPPQARDEAS